MPVSEWAERVLERVGAFEAKVEERFRVLDRHADRIESLQTFVNRTTGGIVVGAALLTIAGAAISWGVLSRLSDNTDEIRELRSAMLASNEPRLEANGIAVVSETRNADGEVTCLALELIDLQDQAEYLFFPKNSSNRQENEPYSQDEVNAFLSSVDAALAKAADKRPLTEFPAFAELPPGILEAHSFAFTKEIPPQVFGGLVSQLERGTVSYMASPAGVDNTSLATHARSFWMRGGGLCAGDTEVRMSFGRQAPPPM